MVLKASGAKCSNSAIETILSKVYTWGKPVQQPPYQWTLTYVIRTWLVRKLPPEDYRIRFPLLLLTSVSSLADMVVQGPNEPEVFAANLLGWLAYSSGSHETDSHLHFNGSLGLLLHVLESQDSMSNDLATCGPFVIDCANAWATRNGGIPNRCTTFAQRVNYFEDLFRVNPTSNIWYSGILEAANATLGNLMEISLRTVLDLARQEEDGPSSRLGLAVAEQYVRAELGDPDLQAGLQAIFRSFQGLGTGHSTVEGQMITRVFHRLRCVLLLFAVLEAPSIQLGVMTQKAQYLGRIVISFCRKQAIRRSGPIEDYYLSSWHNFTHLLLGGIALRDDEQTECIFHARV